MPSASRTTENSAANSETNENGYVTPRPGSVIHCGCQSLSSQYQNLTDHAGCPSTTSSVS